jgi:hypothetical protein
MKSQSQSSTNVHRIHILLSPPSIVLQKHEKPSIKESNLYALLSHTGPLFLPTNNPSTPPTPPHDSTPPPPPASPHKHRETNTSPISLEGVLKRGGGFRTYMFATRTLDRQGKARVHILEPCRAWVIAGSLGFGDMGSRLWECRWVYDLGSSTCVGAI